MMSVVLCSYTRSCLLLTVKEVFKQYFQANANEYNSTNCFNFNMKSLSKMDTNIHSNESEKKTGKPNNRNSHPDNTRIRDKYDAGCQCVDAGC